MAGERLLAALLAAALGSCAVTPAPTVPAPLGMFGTDAQVAASKPDAVLRYGEHRRAFAELRLPAGRGPFPLAVIFHGGCWKAGIADHAYMAPLATRWQQQGIASLNVDYREVGDGGGWPGSFADWQGAATLIEEAARKHPIDRDRVTLVGHSAGALPALWLPSPQTAAGPQGARPPIRARAAIVLDGPGAVGREQPAFDALCQFAAVEPFLAGDLATRSAALEPAPLLRQVLFVQAVLPDPPPASLAAVGAGGAAVTVRANAGASHFAIITPGDPLYVANEPAMMKVLRGE